MFRFWLKRFNLIIFIHPCLQIFNDIKRNVNRLHFQYYRTHLVNVYFDNYHQALVLWSIISPASVHQILICSLCGITPFGL